MRNMTIVFAMLLMMSAHAADQKKYQHPSADEISANRACFSSLESRGCGSADKDHELFRSCVTQIQDTLDENCRKTLVNLYGE